MINFSTSGNKIFLHYTPERQENWVDEAISRRPYITLKKTFTFWKDLYVTSDKSHTAEDEAFSDFGEFETSTFLFAILDGDYFGVIKGILINDFDIYFHKSISLTSECFVADSNVAVFRIISKIFKGDIFIGGDRPNSLPFDAYTDLLKYFPTLYERKRYVEARISSVFRNYFDNVKDAERSYQKYLDKKLAYQGGNLSKTFQEYEFIKYNIILDKLKVMLSEEAQYSEHQWQEEVLQIVLLLYPKYVFAFREVPVFSKFTNGINEKFLDFLLVDSNGNTDIIEIKKPFENAIMTKGVYRDNFIPLRELSGTVMQIEKYIYYLNRWSEEGEKHLTNRYKDNLPAGFNIKITNPSGIIIMGRENNLSDEQKRDFEVVKRKYKNVVDIITYDSLIERLETTIRQIKRI
ncbi:MAG: DUF4263 domain-containing protein [Bacteroidetes bacterium]|nr:MAG: DUF4263 domain-containing protein [Bacteroidota bacterium]